MSSIVLPKGCDSRSAASAQASDGFSADFYIVPFRYSYVLATIASTGFLNIWQAVKVGRARQRAGVYPPQREWRIH